jgi:hypothetical protein
VAIGYTPKRLASGQLTNSKATLYTVPANTATFITAVYFYNTDNTTDTCNLYLNDGTSRLIWTPGVTASGVSFQQNFILNAADLIEGYDVTAASKVNYFIFGVEKTLS